MWRRRGEEQVDTPCHFLPKIAFWRVFQFCHHEVTVRDYTVCFSDRRQDEWGETLTDKFLRFPPSSSFWLHSLLLTSNSGPCLSVGSLFVLSHLWMHPHLERGGLWRQERGAKVNVLRIQQRPVKTTLPQGELNLQGSWTLTSRNLGW